jgi:hypothetical protein
VSKLLSKCQRLLSRCQGCCRGGKAAVEMSRQLSRCRSRHRGVEAAVEVSKPPSRCQGRRRGATLKAFAFHLTNLFSLSMPSVCLLFKKNSCRVPWRLTPFPFVFNNLVVSSDGIVGFIESEVLAFPVPPKAAVEASRSSRCRHSRGFLQQLRHWLHQLYHQYLWCLYQQKKSSSCRRC